MSCETLQKAFWCVIAVPEEELLENGQRNIWGNNGWYFSVVDGNYKLIDPRSSVNSKQKKHEELQQVMS